MARRKKEPDSADISASRRILRLDGGTEFEITGENGKYFLCGATRFRKGNPRIVSVTEQGSGENN